MIKGKNTMKTVKWDDTYFNSSSKYIWIYNCGKLERTNNRSKNSQLLKNYRRPNIKHSIHTQQENVAIKV